MDNVYCLLVFVNYADSYSKRWKFGVFSTAGAAEAHEKPSSQHRLTWHQGRCPLTYVTSVMYRPVMFDT